MTQPPPLLSPSDPLLTPQQVADFLGASLRTIQRRIADHSIRTLKLGRIVRIPASEIGRLLDGSSSKNDCLEVHGNQCFWTIVRTPHE